LKKLRLDSETNGFPITSIREIKLLSRINHPNIIKLKEVCVGFHKDSIFLVFEYCSYDINAFLSILRKQKQTLKIEEIKSIMIQLLRAVNHLHSENIIHRDLKLSNILVSRDGSIKICDFGLARTFGNNLEKPKYTPKVITLWYRSPEILLNMEYNHKCDIWSLGCIFAELLNFGNPIFAGKNELNQFEIICELIGKPNKEIWPNFFKLENSKSLLEREIKSNNIFKRFSTYSISCNKLLNSFLKWDPNKRISAGEAMLSDFFSEYPYPNDLNFKTYGL
jgi:serine/threonine protein kinase